MERAKRAIACHEKGYNCCQSVLAAFSDRIALPEDVYLRLGSGFGSGAGTGELCGALSGAIMALDLILPADLSDPVGSKKAAAARSRRLQERFTQIFGALRCRELLHGQELRLPESALASQLQVSGHCAAMIVTAVELTEAILQEERI